MRTWLLAATVAGALFARGPAFAGTGTASATGHDPEAMPAQVATGDTVLAGDLAKELRASLARPVGQRPLLLHVGFHRLYRSSHIPGSRHVGAASTPDGLAALRNATKGVPRDREIILYCGCCPWKDCPNIRPAIGELHRLGFRKVRALYLPKDFYTDWADQGLPVAKGD